MGEELLATGDIQNGVEHLSLAVAVCGQPHAFQCVGRQRCAVLTGPLHHLLGKARGQPLGGRWLDGSDHADGPDPSMI